MVRLPLELGIVAVAHPSSQIVVNNPSISNHHLKIYSITYDDEPRQVFVYAQDISTNGSRWIYNSGCHYEESSMGRGVAVLLDDGDKIKICDGTCFIFSCGTAKQPVGKAPYADHVQQTEIDVSRALDYLNTNLNLSATVIQELVSFDKPAIRSRRLWEGAFGCRPLSVSPTGLQDC